MEHPNPSDTAVLTARTGPPIGPIEQALDDVARYSAGLVQVRLTHPGTPRADLADAQAVALEALACQFDQAPDLDLTGEHVSTLDRILQELAFAHEDARTEAAFQLAKRWYRSVDLLRAMATLSVAA